MLTSYKKLIKEVAVRAKLTPEVIDIVLMALTEVLSELPAGGETKTPMGIFKMFYRKEKPVLHPVTMEPTVAPAEYVLKFRAGCRTRKAVNSSTDSDSSDSETT
jgi:nucleoid DNA-binding protein